MIQQTEETCKFNTYHNLYIGHQEFGNRPKLHVLGRDIQGEVQAFLHLTPVRCQNQAANALTNHTWHTNGLRAPKTQARHSFLRNVGSDMVPPTIRIMHS